MCEVRRVVLCLGLAACGRIGFDDHGPAGAVDGQVIAGQGACAPGTAVADPFRVSGRTFEFPRFDQTAPVDGVAITAFDATTGEFVASATSASDGGYALDIHGGVARALRLDLKHNTYVVTHQYTGVFLAGDLAGYQSPLWHPESLDAVYGPTGVTRDPALGNVNVAIQECDGTPIEGATVTFEPPAKKLAYLDTGSVPDTSLPATTVPYSSAVGFNVPTTTLHIVAAKPGRMFDPVDVVVGGGDTNVIVMRAYP